jgi:hypothetical protein
MDQQGDRAVQGDDQPHQRGDRHRDGRPDDPPEGGRVDIPEVILEQIQTFDDKWIKGSKEAREAAALVFYNQFWPRIEASRPRRSARSRT